MCAYCPTPASDVCRNKSSNKLHYQDCISECLCWSLTNKEIEVMCAYCPTPASDVCRNKSSNKLHYQDCISDVPLLVADQQRNIVIIFKV
jgi:hypothetical protein